VPSSPRDEQPAPAPAKRRGRWLDRAIGILLGLALGIGVIALFVFESSEDTIDAARISGLERGQGQRGGGGGDAAQVPLVQVIDGKPPPSGPVRLDFRRGRDARFVVGSDRAVGLEVTGLGVSRDVDAGRTLVSFRLPRPGQFPLVVADTKIVIATLRVEGH
jgi:hypothetical protein